MSQSAGLRLGLIVNPLAGIGGAVALKGSDGAQIQAEAMRRGGTGRGIERTREFLAALCEQVPDAPARIQWLCWGEPMGAQLLQDPIWNKVVLGTVVGDPSSQDTVAAAQTMLGEGMDLLVFAGGDGTARDIMSALGTRVPVIGVPAGVKMHSGVFAVTPRAAAQVAARLLQGHLVAPVLREVKDFDPASADADGFTVRQFGELLVPEAGGYLQQTKVGGKESEPLAVEEICADVLERIDLQRTLVLGPGSTCARIKQALDMPVTLRGCDVRRADGVMLEDVQAQDLERLDDVTLVISFTRAQGFMFGRGNQQLSAAFLARLNWPHDVLVVGTRTKLASCDGRPLLVDTGEAGLDRKLSGLVQIITGYQDTVLYRVADGT